MAGLEQSVTGSAPGRAIQSVCIPLFCLLIIPAVLLFTPLLCCSPADRIQLALLCLLLLLCLALLLNLLQDCCCRLRLALVSSAGPHTMATDPQELPPDAMGPTAEHVATQLALRLAAISSRNKPAHSPTLCLYLGAFSFGKAPNFWWGLVGAPRRDPQNGMFLMRLSVSKVKIHIIYALGSRILTFDPSLHISLLVVCLTCQKHVITKLYSVRYC